jgi:hypothetical protein
MEVSWHLRSLGGRMRNTDEELVATALSRKDSTDDNWTKIANDLGVSVARLRRLRKEYSGIDQLRSMDRAKVTVFISHLHEDAPMAQVLQDTLVEWGLDRQQVWRSSDPASGVTPGNSIPDDIKSFLFECNLVLYVFTSSEKNWEWCSWEIGLAEEPTNATRIVTFQMLDDSAPKIQPASLRVGMTTNDIEGFVKSFFSDDGFFPGFTAFWPGREDTTLKNYAERLHRALDEIRSSYNSGEESRWGSITLEVSGADLAECEAVAQDEDDARRSALMNCLRLVATEGWGVRHFGYNSGARAIADSPTLRDMVNQWEAATGDLRENPMWAVELVDEIWRSSRNQAPRLSWDPSPSAYEEASFFYPVLTRVYKTNDGSRRYFIRVFAMDSRKDLSYAGDSGG